jgi:hypothetical protein
MPAVPRREPGRLCRRAGAERIATATGLCLSQHRLLGTRKDIDDVVAAIAKVAARVDELATVVSS